MLVLDTRGRDCWGSLEPFWGINTMLLRKGAAVQMQCWDQDKFSADDLIGSTFTSFQDFVKVFPESSPRPAPRIPGP